MSTKESIQRGLDAIDYAAKEKSEEEHTELFLNHIDQLVKYWGSVPHQSNTEKLEGLAFSILSALDGCSVGLSPYILTPLVVPEGEDDWVSSELDITGALHDQFARLCREK